MKTSLTKIGLRVVNWAVTSSRHDFAARNNDSYISQQQLRQNYAYTVEKRNNMSSAKFK